MDIEAIKRDVAVALQQSKEYKLKIEQLELMSKSWTLEDFCMDLPNPIECSIDTLANGKIVLGKIKLSDYYSWLNPVKIETSNHNPTIVIETRVVEMPVDITEVKVFYFPRISLTNPAIVFEKGTSLNNHMVNILHRTINTIRSTLMLELAKKRIDRDFDRIMNRVVKSTNL